MLIDEIMFRIMALSFGWGTGETDRFLEQYTVSNLNMILDKFFTFLQDNLPERMEELKKVMQIDDEGKFKPFTNAEAATKAYQILIDQLDLVITSYPELSTDLVDSIYYLEKELFLFYMRNGSDAGRLAVIDRLKERFEETPTNEQVHKYMLRLTRDKQVNEVLGGPIYIDIADNDNNNTDTNNLKPDPVESSNQDPRTEEQD